MSMTESKSTMCSNCKKLCDEGMKFCPHCGHSLKVSETQSDNQDLQKPLGCFAYTLIGIISPLLPVLVIYFLSLSNIFTEDALAVIAALLSLGIYPAVWFFAAKGWYGKVDFYGYINVFLLSFIPFLNWLVVYYLGKGLYMFFTKQEIKNPPKASKAGLIILLSIVGLSIVFSIFSSSVGQSPAPVSLTFTPKPTQRPPTATPKPVLSYNNIPCVSWRSITSRDLESKLCIYGKVYNYGPYANEWTFIQFSEEANALRVMDFNYYYYSPLKFGDCVMVYGRIRDYGPYLIITPDKDDTGSIKVGDSSLCN
jgi:hypothetical protein